MLVTQDLYTHNICILNPLECLKNIKVKVSGSRIKKISRLDKFEINTAQSAKYIISPGFINLHVHSLFTKIKGAETPLFDWLQEIIPEGFHLSDRDKEEATAICIQAIQKSGCTMWVDNTNQEEYTLSALKNYPLRTIIASEIFGSNPHKATEIFSSITNKQKSLLERLTNDKDLQNIIGLALSPHSPYNVSAPLWHKILESTSDLVFSHLAETQAENLWFAGAQIDSEELSSLKNFWNSLDLLNEKLNYREIGFASSYDWLSKKNIMGKKRQLWTHAIHLSNSELEQIANKQTISLITCPRSNRYLRSGKANVAEWQKKGILWGIGTDSLASNYSLDIREEAAELFSQCSYQDIFAALTLNAAKSLGMDTQLGSLAEGKFADYAVWEITDKSLDNNANWQETIDPYAYVLDTTKSKLLKLYVGGKAVYSRS